MTPQFKDRKIDTVILVSSPTHAPRCVRDAARVFAPSAPREALDVTITSGSSEVTLLPATPDEEGDSYSPTVLVSPCNTDFGNGATVIEPQHRSDRDLWVDQEPELQLNALAARALKIHSKTFHHDLNKLLRSFEVVERRKQSSGKGMRGMRLAFFGLAALLLAAAADLGPLAGGGSEFYDR